MRSGAILLFALMGFAWADSDPDKFRRDCESAGGTWYETEGAQVCSLKMDIVININLNSSSELRVCGPIDLKLGRCLR